MSYDYGNWLLVLFNIVLFLYFVKAAFRPRTKTEWATYRTFGAFIAALFAEMYGFPLTIYLLTSYFGNNFLGLDLTHNSGHLLNDLLGLKGDPHFSLFHIFSNVFIVGGLILLSSAWSVLYQASKKNLLATVGVYRYMRHPQYFAFILIIIGFLLQWPTLVTLIMAPILIVRYVTLAKSEEKQMVDKFGQVYRDYRSKTPGFLPSLTLVVKDVIQKIRNSADVIVPNKIN
jgi:protein-S-isoprenylcysteine O-methyltransferase Ste14